MTTFRALLLLPILCVLTSCKAQATVVELKGPIDADSAAKAISDLHDARGSDRIILKISSPGGGVFEALDVIAAIRESQPAPMCVCTSLCASAAALVLESCEHRAALSSAIIMLHQASGEAAGKEGDMANTLNALHAIDVMMEQVVSKASGLTMDQVHALIADGKECWLTASEALRLGLVQVVF